MDLLQSFDEGGLAGVDLLGLLIDVALALLLSQVLAWHYQRYAQVLSNKRKFSRLFVFVATTTLLVISVVKTSLALSLGLVGALSIIRFRTPIKEPEELAYLFLSIAIGIGLGGDQPVVTVVVFTLVLAYLTIRSTLTGTRGLFRTVLQVTAPMSAVEGVPPTGEEELMTLLPAIQARTSKVDLRRVDCHESVFNASLFVEIPSIDDVAALLAGIQRALPGAQVSVVERDGLE